MFYKHHTKTIFTNKALLSLFIVQIFFGFVKTISSPAFDTLYARHLDKSSAGQEYGIWEASFFVPPGLDLF